MSQVFEIDCAEAGRNAAAAGRAKGERLFSSASTLLHERGPYAMFLYLTKECPAVERALFQLLVRQNRVGLRDDQDSLLQIAEAYRDRFPDVMHARMLLGRALDYARAHVKAHSDSSDGEQAPG